MGLVSAQRRLGGNEPRLLPRMTPHHVRVDVVCRNGKGQGRGESQSAASKVKQQKTAKNRANQKNKTKTKQKQNENKTKQNRAKHHASCLPHAGVSSDTRGPRTCPVLNPFWRIDANAGAGSRHHALVAVEKSLLRSVCARLLKHQRQPEVLALKRAVFKLHACVCVHVCVSVSVCACVCECECVCVCMCVCVSE